jgi:hypothetical protein
LSVDDDGTLGTFERRVATDGLTVLAGEETIAAGQQITIGSEGLQCKDGSSSLLGPRRTLGYCVAKYEYGNK